MDGDYPDKCGQQEVVEIRRAIAHGLEQLDRGEGIPGEEVSRELREMSERYRAAKRASQGTL